jgi:hypothetical protein
VISRAMNTFEVMWFSLYLNSQANEATSGMLVCIYVDKCASW